VLGVEQPALELRFQQRFYSALPRQTLIQNPKGITPKNPSISHIKQGNAL
jgi:hypothetical protein